jgi:hypothetical protein
MSPARSFTGPRRCRSHADRMDAVAVLIGIAAFILLLYLIDGIERV